MKKKIWDVLMEKAALKTVRFSNFVSLTVTSVFCSDRPIIEEAYEIIARLTDRAIATAEPPSNRELAIEKENSIFGHRTN